MTDADPVPNSSPPPRKGLPARLLVPLIVIGGAIAGVVAISRLPSARRDTPPADPPAVNVRTVPVTVTPELIDTFDLPAVVEPFEVVRVAAEVAAQVDSHGLRNWTGGAATQPGRPPASSPANPALRESDPVRAGQPLIYLNIEILQAELEQARAQARFDLHELERIGGLFAGKLATKQEVDQATLRAALSRAALDVATARMDRAVIRSPLAGTLNRLPVKVGEYVQPGTVVAEVVDASRMKVVLDVPERDVGFLKLGQSPDIVLDPPLARPLRGSITYISELAESGTRTTRVELTVSDPPPGLRSGQIVRVRLLRQVLRDVMLIPLDAVIPTELEQNGQKIRVVYVARRVPATQPGQPGQPATLRAAERRVTLGFLRDRGVQVLSGLAAGEELIVSGHRFCGDGQLIRVVSSSQPDGSAANVSQRE